MRTNICVENVILRDSNAGWDLCTQLQLTRATNVSATEFHNKLLIWHLQVKNYEQEISL